MRKETLRWAGKQASRRATMSIINQAPEGFRTMVKKLICAVYLNHPRHLKRFLAEHLEAELDRRTLEELQFAVEGDFRYLFNWPSFNDIQLIDRIDFVFSDNHRAYVKAANLPL